MNQDSRQKHYAKKQQLSISLFLTIFSILIICVATLYPFNFLFPHTFSRQELGGSFDNNSDFTDTVNNVLLFMPFGFGLASILQHKRAKLIVQILTVVLLSATLSMTVEILQILLPSRAPTPADILNNTIGGFIGLFCFYLWNSRGLAFTLQRIETSQTSNSLSKTTLFFVGYIFLTLLIFIPWQSTSNLNAWNDNFPLALGNETTGGRPWEGYVSQLYIADKAYSSSEIDSALSLPNYFHNQEKSLVAAYELTGENKYQDKTGHLPNLIWQGKKAKSDSENEKGAFLSSDRWLLTASPATFLNKRISETSEFTLSTTVATTSIQQTGPARIISVSDGSLQRNFTLGQEGKDLVFRLRTPITGENGAELKLEVSNIFTGSNFHQIIVTYANSKLRIYVDELQNAYSLNLLELIPKEQRLFYYGITFIPVGLVLVFVSSLAKRKLPLYRLLLATGILLPSIILESILISDSGKSPSLKNLSLGILFTAGTMLLLKIRTQKVS